MEVALHQTASHSWRMWFSQATWLLVIITAAWLFHLYALVLPTSAVVLVWLIVSWLIARGLFRRRRIKRKAWLEASLYEHASLHKRLRGGPFLYSCYLAIGSFLSAGLLATLPHLNQSPDWALLSVGSVVLLMTHAFATRQLRLQVKPPFLHEAAWWLSILFTLTALIIAYMALALHSAQPDFLTSESGFLAAIQYMVDNVSARSELFQYVLQCYAALDGARWWTGQTLENLLSASAIPTLLSWTVIFFQQAFFILGWLLMLTGFFTKDIRYE